MHGWMITKTEPYFGYYSHGSLGYYETKDILRYNTVLPNNKILMDIFNYAM